MPPCASTAPAPGPTGQSVAAKSNETRSSSSYSVDRVHMSALRGADAYVVASADRRDASATPFDIPDPTAVVPSVSSWRPRPTSGAP